MFALRKPLTWAHLTDMTSLHRARSMRPGHLGTQANARHRPVPEAPLQPPDKHPLFVRAAVREEPN